jgi:hypothetical protein
VALEEISDGAFAATHAAGESDGEHTSKCTVGVRFRQGLFPTGAEGLIRIIHDRRVEVETALVKVSQIHLGDLRAP